MSEATGELGRTLRDDRLEERLAEVGYVVVDLLDENEVARLVAFYEDAKRAGPINPPGAYNEEYAEFSTVHSTQAFRRAAFAEIGEVVVPRAKQLLVDHRPLIANFVNKPPGTGVVPAHQNLSVVDEARYRSVSVWVALSHVGLHNGTLQFVPGTHRILRGRRGMWAYEAFREVEEVLVSEYLDSLTVGPGQAVVLDDAILHYSAPNLSSENRLAIQLVMVPQEAEPVYFEPTRVDEDGLHIDMLSVRPEFFFDFWNGRGDRSHARLLDRVVVDNRPMDVADLHRRLRVLR